MSGTDRGAQRRRRARHTRGEGDARRLPAHGAPEKKARFAALRAVLEAQLSGIKVFKVGADPEKVVLVVGKTGERQWAGLRTTVVET